MYGLGAPIHLTTSFYNNATPPVLVDSTTVTLYLTLPDATAVNFPAVKDSTGLYHYDYTPLLTGIYQFYFSGTGTNIGIQLPDIFTVAPTAAAGIVSLADTKTSLRKSSTVTVDDNQLWAWIQAATEIVNNECGYTVPTSVTETVAPTVSGDQHRVLVLSKTPVISVQSITPRMNNIPQIDITSLQINKGSGVIYLGNWFSWYGPQQVVYTAGRSVVPASLQQAALLIVQYFWEAQSGGAVSNAVAGFGGQDTETYNGMPDFPSRALALMRMAPHFAAPGLA